MATIVEEGLRFKIAVHPADPATRSKLERDSRDGDRYCFARKEKRGDQDVTRHFVAGVASGLRQDAHGERMSQKCVDDFLEQAETKDILLMVNHHRNFTESVAILTHSEPLENGDWYIEARLLDEYDLEDHPTWGSRIAEADDLRAQMTGSKPYSRPRVFGFSVEGWVLDYDKETKTIHRLDLEAIAIVTRPAYETSVASSLEKCMKSWSRGVENAAPESESPAPRAKGILSDRIAIEEAESKRLRLEWAFNDVLRETIMDSELTVEEQKARLQSALDEYVAAMEAFVAEFGEGLSTGDAESKALVASIKSALGSGDRLSAKQRASIRKMVPASKSKDVLSARMESKDAEGDFYDRLVRIEEAFEEAVEDLLESSATTEEKAAHFEALIASYGNNLKSLYEENNWTEPGENSPGSEDAMENKEPEKESEEENKQAAGTEGTLSTIVEKLDMLLDRLQAAPDESNKSSGEDGAPKKDTEEERDETEEEDSSAAAKALKSVVDQLAAIQADGAKGVQVDALEKLAKSVEAVASRVEGIESAVESTLKSIFGLGEEEMSDFATKSAPGAPNTEAKGSGASIGDSDLVAALGSLIQAAKSQGAGGEVGDTSFAAKSQSSSERVRSFGKAVAGQTAGK